MVSLMKLQIFFKVFMFACLIMFSSVEHVFCNVWSPFCVSTLFLGGKKHNFVLVKAAFELVESDCLYRVLSGKPPFFPGKDTGKTFSCREGHLSEKRGCVPSMAGAARGTEQPTGWGTEMVNSLGEPGGLFLLFVVACCGYPKYPKWGRT